MKKLAAFLCFTALGVAQALAGSMPLMGAGPSAAGPAPLTITQIAECQETVNDSTLTCNTTVNVAAGETIFIAWAGSSSALITAISDGTANTYTTGASENSAQPSTQTMYILNPVAVASGSTYTVTLGAATDRKNFSAWKLNRTATHGTVGTGAASSSTPSCSTSGSLPSGAAVVGVSSENGADGYTPVGGIWVTYYNGTNNTRDQIYEAGVTTSSGVVTFNPVLGGSRNWSCSVDSFQ